MYSDLALTPNKVAADIDQYVGRCLNELQDDHHALNYDVLLPMCSPNFNWDAYKPEGETPYAILKGLFINPKMNFYQTNPEVNDYHNPELQHALRHILLRRLLQEKLDEKQKLNAEDQKSFVAFATEQKQQINELLIAQSDEYQKLGREIILYKKTNRFWLAASIASIAVTIMLPGVLIGTTLYARRDKIPISIIVGFSAYLLFSTVKHLKNHVQLLTSSLPKEIHIQIGESLDPFPSYQEKIKLIMEALGLLPPLQASEEKTVSYRPM